MNDKQPDIQTTLDERGKKYGSFVKHADLSQRLLDVCKGAHGLVGMPALTTWEDMRPFQQEALTLICHKIARILNGDPNYDDSWRDIAGYAQLVVNILNGELK